MAAKKKPENTIHPKAATIISLLPKIEMRKINSAKYGDLEYAPDIVNLLYGVIVARMAEDEAGAAVIISLVKRCMDEKINAIHPSQMTQPELYYCLKYVMLAGNKVAEDAVVRLSKAIDFLARECLRVSTMPEYL